MAEPVPRAGRLTTLTPRATFFPTGGPPLVPRQETRDLQVCYCLMTFTAKTQGAQPTHSLNPMKKLLAITSALAFCVGCANSYKGDDLVKKGKYAEAYATYMLSCNDTTLPMKKRLIGCGAGRDLRTEARRYGIDTSNW